MRMDHYVQIGVSRVHWIGIFSSLVVIFILIFFVWDSISSKITADFKNIELAVLRRNERRQQAQNSVDESQSLRRANADAGEEVKWKRLQGDVMRQPPNAFMFALFMGIGSQIFVLFWFFLLCAMILAYMNVFYRPALFSLFFLWSAVTSFVNGYVTGKVMRLYGATDWCFAAISASVVFPLYSIGFFLAVDLIEYLKHSSFETPLLTIMFLGVLWLSLAIPLSFRGAYSAFTGEKEKNSLRVSRITKTKVPDMPCFLD